jgi:glycosyltransferase involved in cell wall biosynthesis
MRKKMSSSTKSSPVTTGIPEYTIKTFKPKKYDYALVIPVLNENGRINEQLDKIKKLSPEVDTIIADGGSTDGSVDYLKLERANVSKLLVIKSEGQLSAQLRMAFHFCLNEGYRGVITMDGNNKDGVSGIIEIQNRLEDGYDFVQGSRFIKNGRSINTPFLRYVAIRFVHAPLMSLGAKRWLTDTTNGFRGHSRNLLKSEDLSIFRQVFQKYELLSYIPIAAAKNGFKLTEVGVVREYPTQEPTPTKIKGFKNHLSIVIVLFKTIIGAYNQKNKTIFKNTNRIP